MSPWSMLLEPAVLFFVLGALVAVIGSNLEIPQPVAKFLSLYLLMAVGFKGGQSLAHTGLSGDVVRIILIAMLLAIAIPAWSFLILRRGVNTFDAAAIAATYGSVSAVTFTVASQFVAAHNDPTSGGATVALVLMESPAIVMAVLLASWARTHATAKLAAFSGAEGSISTITQPGVESVVPEAIASADPTPGPLRLRAVLHEAFTDGAHLLLIGSLIVGAVTGEKGAKAMQPFTGDLFKGFLGFFLLEMGILVGRQLREVRDVGPFLFGFGLVMPPIHALIAILLCKLAGVSSGDAVLVAVLGASASYIVVPAVVRYAIPEARPSRYFTMALAVTFPFNVLVGIPLYHGVVQRIWS
jgi:uncharacterized protein